MKKYIVIKDKTLFFIKAKSLKEAKEVASVLGENKNAQAIVRQYEKISNNPLRWLVITARDAIGETLLKLNAQNKETGWTKGLEWGFIDEMDSMTRVLSDINEQNL